VAEVVGLASAGVAALARANVAEAFAVSIENNCVVVEV